MQTIDEVDGRGRARSRSTGAGVRGSAGRSTCGRWASSSPTPRSCFDDALVLKVFRASSRGTNPELEMLRFLTAARLPEHRAAARLVRVEGALLDATLGVAQEFSPTARDGWELALDELGADPDRFLERLRELGEVTGEMHTVLGSDADRPRVLARGAQPGVAVAADRDIDEEIERLFLDCPTTTGARADHRPRPGVRERLQLLSHVGAAAADPPPRRPAPRPDAAGTTAAGSSSTSRASRRAR